MTPERKEFALKRVTRLKAKLEQIEGRLVCFRAKPRSYRVDHLITVCLKEKASSLAALKRWQGELAKDGVTA